MATPAERFPSEESLHTVHKAVEMLIWAGREQVRNEPIDAMDLAIVRGHIADIGNELAFIRRESNGQQPPRRIGSGWPAGVDKSIRAIAAAMDCLREKWRLDREPSAADMFNGDIGDNVEPVLDARDHAALLEAMNVLRQATGEDKPTIMERFDAEMERYRSRDA